MARESLGKVLNMSSRGFLVKAPRMVPIGTKVVDVRQQPAGRVSDVIGTVAAPYLVVSVPKGRTSSLSVGREVFLP